MNTTCPGVTTLQDLQRRLVEYPYLSLWKLRLGVPESTTLVRGIYVMSENLVLVAQGTYFHHREDAFQGPFMLSVYYLGLWGDAVAVDTKVIAPVRENGLTRVDFEIQGSGGERTYQVVTSPHVPGLEEQKKSVSMVVTHSDLLKEELRHLPWGTTEVSQENSVLTVRRTQRVWNKPNWYSAAVETAVELGTVVVDPVGQTIGITLSEFPEVETVRDRLTKITDRFKLSNPGEIALPIPASISQPDASTAPIPAPPPPE